MGGSACPVSCRCLSVLGQVLFGWVVLRGCVLGRGVRGGGGCWAFESVEFHPRGIRLECITIFLNTFLSNHFQTLQDY